MDAALRRPGRPGVHVSFMFDQSTYIHDQLGSLSNSILLAIVLVMIIVVAALGLRSGLLVGVAIPTSFLMAFLVLNGVGMHAELHDHVRDAAGGRHPGRWRRSSSWNMPTAK